MRAQRIGRGDHALRPSFYVSIPQPMEIQETLKSLVGSAKNYVALQLENAKLTAAEKLSILFSTVALFAIAFFIGLAALVFLTIGLASMLESLIAPFWIYLIVGAFFILLIILLFAFKQPLIIDPVARFLSRLFIDPPKPKE